MATFETLLAAMLPLVVPANTSAALVLLLVSAASVVVEPELLEPVVEPELLLEPVVEDVGSDENALEADPAPQPASQRLVTKIAAAFPSAHKRKSRLLRRRYRR